MQGELSNNIQNTIGGAAHCAENGSLHSPAKAEVEALAALAEMKGLGSQQQVTAWLRSLGDEDRILFHHILDKRKNNFTAHTDWMRGPGESFVPLAKMLEIYVAEDIGTLLQALSRSLDEAVFDRVTLCLSDSDRVQSSGELDKLVSLGNRLVQEFPEYFPYLMTPQLQAFAGLILRKSNFPKEDLATLCQDLGYEGALPQITLDQLTAYLENGVEKIPAGYFQDLC